MGCHFNVVCSMYISKAAYLFGHIPKNCVLCYQNCHSYFIFHGINLNCNTIILFEQNLEKEK